MSNQDRWLSPTQSTQTEEDVTRAIDRRAIAQSLQQHQARHSLPHLSQHTQPLDQGLREADLARQTVAFNVQQRPGVRAIKNDEGAISSI